MNYIQESTQNNSIYAFCDTLNERSILSIIVYNEDAFFYVLTKASEEDFLAPDSKIFFNILCLLQKSGYTKYDKLLLVKTATDLDAINICSEMFIDAILNLKVEHSNIQNYVSRLLDNSTKYKLFRQLQQHNDTILSNTTAIGAKSCDSLISALQSDLISLSTLSEAIAEPKHVADNIEEYIESIADVHTPIMGLSTGFPILDKVIDGLIPGTLMVIAARKKMGKSTVLTNIAANVAINDGQATLYIDTEMTFKEWRDRVLAIISGVQERIIKHGGFKNNKEVYERVINAAKYLKKSKLFHHYLPGYNLEKISALYKKYKFKEDIKLAIFDYIKEPESSSINASRKEYQILGDVTTRLKDLSGQLDIPFLAAVQINRSGDVADSDRVARYGDIVAFWELRSLKAAEEESVDLDVVGHYALNIKDSRRGGVTGDWGIGFKFKKTKLKIIEVEQENQVEQFDYLNDLTFDNDFTEKQIDNTTIKTNTFAGYDSLL